MAEGPRMTAAQVADKLLASEHADVLRQCVAWMVAEPIEAEVTAQIGAELGQRTPDRVAQRNGYRPRAWDTRVGELELRIPRLRTGSNFPSSWSHAGGPSRPWSRCPGGLGQRGQHPAGGPAGRAARYRRHVQDQVSRLCRGLDTQVRVFRERPLEGRYPYLWLDAKVERVREPGGVRHKSLVIAYGVHQTGRREVIGVDVGGRGRGVLAGVPPRPAGPWTPGRAAMRL